MNYRDIIARNLTSREHSIGKIRIDTYYHNQRIVEVDLRMQIGHSFTRINLTYPNLFNEKMFLRRVNKSISNYCNRKFLVNDCTEDNILQVYEYIVNQMITTNGV